MFKIKSNLRPKAKLINQFVVIAAVSTLLLPSISVGAVYIESSKSVLVNQSILQPSSQSSSAISKIFGQTTTQSSASKPKNNLKNNLKLPVKMNLLGKVLHTAKGKHKLLNDQNGVAVADNWWQNDISGNNTIAGNQMINGSCTTTCVLPNLTKTKIAIIDSGIDESAVLSLYPNTKFDNANASNYYSTNDDPNCDINNAYKPMFELDINGNVTQSTTSFYCITIGAQQDNIGHGTAVAGVTASMYNDSLFASNISIMPIAVQNGAFDSLIVSDAVRYAVNNGANIINMSFGSVDYSLELQDAVDYAMSRGVIVIASSGNCGVWTANNCDYNNNGIQDTNIPQEQDNAPMYPANYRGVIAVGASNYATSTDQITKSAYSNSMDYDIANSLSLVAPVGDGINVACVNPVCYDSGTSFASPQMAGALALVGQYRSFLSKLNDFDTPKYTQYYTFDTQGNALANIVNSASFVSSDYVSIGSGLLNLFNAIVLADREAKEFVDYVDIMSSQQNNPNNNPNNNSSSAIPFKTNIPTNPNGGMITIDRNKKPETKTENKPESQVETESLPLSLPSTLFKFLGLGNQAETTSAVLTIGKGSTVRTGGR